MTSFAVILCPLLVSIFTSSAYGLRLKSRPGPIALRPRVIGGLEVTDRCKAPYNSMVALQFESSAYNTPVTFCSAVMLTETILVTSANCLTQLQDLSDLTITIVVGDRDMMFKDKDEQKIKYESYKIHKNYDSSTKDNNIGLIRLATPAKLTPCVQPVMKLEEDPMACTDVDRSCVMAGWGPYADNDVPTNSRLPRSAAITVLGDFVSSLLFRGKWGIDPPKGTVLAEGINPNNRACYFDWGGIVSCKRNGKFVLRGVVSDHNCRSDMGTPILVTDVPFFQPWIDSCLNDWAKCN